MPEPPDRHAQLTHALDQLGATLAQLVPILQAHYQALRRAGFTSAQAMNLVVALQQSLIDRTE